AGMDLDPANLDRNIECDEPDVGVADAGVEPEELEAQGADLVQVARAAAGDVADAAELLMDRGGGLPQPRAQAGRVVEVLADGNLGAAPALDVAEVIAEKIGMLRLAGIRGLRAGLGGHGVTDDRAEVWQQTPDVMRQEAGMPRPHVK